LEHRHRVTRLIGIVATLAVAFAIANVHLYRPVAASGAVLTVTGQGSEDPANNFCDLEEAVKAAVTSNYNDCTASGYGDDTILLSGTVTLTNSLLVNGGGNLTLTEGGTIEWAGAPHGASDVDQRSLESAHRADRGADAARQPETPESMSSTRRSKSSSPRSRASRRGRAAARFGLNPQPPCV
jgi:hypothetical protein